MGGTIDWQGSALATLRRRMATAEADRADAVAFARGHAGATAAIHASLLALAAADDRRALARVVTREWPALLGLDRIVLALGDGRRAERLDRNGSEPLEPRLLQRFAREAGDVAMRCVARGHPLFGSHAGSVRSEALVSFSGRSGFVGLLLLADGAAAGFDCDESAALLGFLGRMLCAMLERCPTR